jgi:hypothetical protein
MALPLLLIVLWRTEATGGLTHRWFDWDYKWEYLLRMFRGPVGGVRHRLRLR